MRPVSLSLHCFLYFVTKHSTGPVAKCGRFVYLCANRPILIRNNRFSACYRPVWGGFFVPSRIWPFLGVFRAFRRSDGTSYRPGRKSVLNRKFAENNFFWPQT